ncbi:tetratricopeptide repeat protein [Streptomyces sp. NPDC047014]|uniref:AfsR/SARP family transcriptional regulator n=1 Tax=Streptomyces sp. NPDC047014 TaxID=3155736 RepID=UPI0033C83E38
MEFAVLGPRDAFSAGQPILLRRPKAAALATALLIAPGFQAPHSDLKAFVWPGRPVDGTALRRQLSDLRQLLPTVKLTSAGGMCTLEVPRDCVDLTRFEDLWESAESESGKDRLDIRRAALRTWHDGGPLQHIGTAAFDDARARLHRLWRTSWLTFLKSALDLSAIPLALEDTARLMDLWPGDQDVFALRLQALAACYERASLRQEIAGWTDEHGAPGPLLRSVIASVTGTGSATRRPDGRGSRPSRPWQLPPPGHRLVGRDNELRELGKALVGTRRSRRRLILLTGPAGIGKSALTRDASARHARKFEAVLYADLMGCTWNRPGGIDPEDVLTRFLDDLGVEPIPTSLSGKTARYRSALAERKVLVVLDNARDAEQVFPLLPGDGPSATVVNSRNALWGLRDSEEAHIMPISPIDRAAATALLLEAVGLENRAANRRYVDRIIEELTEICGGLPLALSIIAERIRRRPLSDLRVLIEELRRDGKKLDALQSTSQEERSVRLAFDCSYRDLSESATLLLRQLAIHPGPSISWQAVVDLGPAAGIQDPGRAADELITASLLLPHTSERYQVHDLVRTYAREAVPGLTAEVRAATVKRICDHTLQSVWVCDQMLQPGRHLPIEPRPDLALVPPEDEGEAMDRLEAEYDAATAVLALAQEAGASDVLWLLPMALITYQWRRSHYSQAARNLQLALEASVGLAGPSDRAMILRMVAGCHRNQGKLEVAAGNLHHAAALSEQGHSPEDRRSLALTLNVLGVVQRERGMADEAEEHFVRALDLSRSLNDLQGTAGALSGLAMLDLDRGAGRQALDHALAAQDLFDRTTDLSGQAAVTVTLGDIHGHLADLPSAATAYGAAAQQFRRLGYWAREASTLRSLSRVQLLSGNRTGVRESLRRARTLEARVSGRAPVQRRR